MPRPKLHRRTPSPGARAASRPRLAEHGGRQDRAVRRCQAPSFTDEPQARVREQQAAPRVAELGGRQDRAVRRCQGPSFTDEPQARVREQQADPDWQNSEVVRTEGAERRPTGRCIEPAGPRSMRTQIGVATRQSQASHGAAWIMPRVGSQDPRVNEGPRLRRVQTKRKAPESCEQGSGASQNRPGGDLLSHTVSRAVPSALEGLTAVFGMGTGVTPPT